MSIAQVLILFFGVFVSLYFYWNRLREDYISAQIFTSFIYVFLGTLVVFFLAKFFLLPKTNPFLPESGVLFWTSLIGGVLGGGIAIFRFRLKGYEVFEALGMSLLYFLIFVFVADAFLKLSVVSLIAGVVIALVVVLFYFLETKYKNLNWYASGKVGFSGLTCLGIFFLLRAGIASLFPYVLSFLGKYESMVGSVAGFVLFLSVFNLSRQK